MMTVTAPEEHRAKKGLLAQGLAPQHQLLHGGERPTAAAESRIDHDLLTTRAGHQVSCLAWAQ